MATEADRLVDHYRSVAAAHGVRLGENEQHTRAPDFNLGTVPAAPQALDSPVAPQAGEQAEASAAEEIIE
jgi:hypothetical protein